MSKRRPSDIASRISSLVEEYFVATQHEPDLTVPLSVPLFGAEEVNGALRCLLDRRVTMGGRVEEFESAFAAYIGVEHAVMVNSGSSANLLAIAALASGALDPRLLPGDEVIVPALTWPTTVTPIVQMGCIPVFVDADPRTLNLRPDTLEAAISPRTKAIVPVHVLGNPVPMDQVMSFAEANNLWVIEDTCESLGSAYGGRLAGSFGDAGTFSFYFSHHITTVEGGMLVTNDGVFADVARSLRSHGWTRTLAAREEYESAEPEIDPRFLFVHVGYNLRPMETQAAFGLAQLPRLEEFNERRRCNAANLIGRLAEFGPEIRLVHEQEGGTSTWFAFALVVSNRATRDALSAHLERAGIETRPVIAGNLAQQPAFRDTPHRIIGDLPAAAEVASCGLYIGNHPELEDRHLDHVVGSIRSFFA